jgi:hypothetical protein
MPTEHGFLAEGYLKKYPSISTDCLVNPPSPHLLLSSQRYILKPAIGTTKKNLVFVLMV